jgi:epoxyqueuosine reductase
MNKHRPYTPDPGQMALWPNASGNDINGLGETTFRRPRHVYWSDPDNSTFGAVQKWFYARNSHPDIETQRLARNAIRDVPLPPVAEHPVQKTDAEWTSALKAEALRLGAEDVGVAEMDPDWVYEGWAEPYSHIVVMAIAMDYDTMTQAPEIAAGVEVVRQYARGMKTSKLLSGWLRDQGHDAMPEHGPLAEGFTLVPAALAAGLGELGKHGSIINRKLGSCFRLAAVLCNLPLIPDQPDNFGADDFCARCQLCANACPPEAIGPEKQTVRGATKWYVNFDKCLPFFNETAGCAICITVCPFSRPGVGDNLVAKLARRISG